ncbi:SOS response regulatory protein OraA/RecX [Sphingomonas kyeonggiensis]|uniref:RecX family transcriptional regulator n=1 Tax=Sphingomonas kyeonggiensis TaxID=1268553 RepID=UPI00277D30A3|nr:RecX family transcriptional regulator [Sphingomonas kyeonggiensis]MDQ0252492.1 SOS response regulatory protein OraA/RecX [Sphingomonas kyeonggiensis]
MAGLGYVNDRLYAESKAGAMARRGLGARRVREALRFAGVEEEDAAALAPSIEAGQVSSAIAFAKRKRIGPFGREAAERPLQEKQMAAMIRAGHAPGLARAIVRMAPGDDPEAILGPG